MPTDDHRGSFTTHANYLRAFATLCGYPTVVIGRSTALRDFVVRVRSTVPSDRPAARVPLDDIHRSLVNAWGTELILALSGQYATDDDLLRLVNNWGAVQAYYALYHGTQALALTRGMPRPESHPKTQTIFVDCWGTRSFELPPLSLCVGADGLCCGPRTVPTVDVHPWSSCTPQSAWNIAALALRTTRDDAVEEAIRRKREEKLRLRRREWREEEDERLGRGRRARSEPSFPLPRLTTAEKTDVCRRVRRHSLLDYLYRLRIRTNYEDSRMFTDGPPDQVSSNQVHRDLRRIVQCCLIATELHIRSKVGTTVFDEWVREWVELKTPADVRLGLAARASAFR